MNLASFCSGIIFFAAIHSATFHLRTPGNVKIPATGKTLLLFFLLFFAITPGFSQETQKPSPDGTDGQVFEADTSTSKRKYENWNQFDGKLTTLKIAGGLILDFATYIQDDNAKKQMDSAGIDLENFNMRDFRVQLSGRLKLGIKR